MSGFTFRLAQNSSRCIMYRQDDDRKSGLLFSDLLSTARGVSQLYIIHSYSKITKSIKKKKQKMARRGRAGKNVPKKTTSTFHFLNFFLSSCALRDTRPEKRRPHYYTSTKFALPTTFQCLFRTRYNPISRSVPISIVPQEI